MDLSKSNLNKISIGDFNAKVYVAPSKIISTVPNVDSGNVLFAAEYLSKQIIVAYYSGFIHYDDYLSQNNVEVTYIKNLWQRMSMCGDSLTGDLGIFINSPNKASEANVRLYKYIF